MRKKTHCTRIRLRYFGDQPKRKFDKGKRRRKKGKPKRASNLVPLHSTPEEQRNVLLYVVISVQGLGRWFGRSREQVVV